MWEILLRVRSTVEIDEACVITRAMLLPNSLLSRVFTNIPFVTLIIWRKNTVYEGGRSLQTTYWSPTKQWMRSYPSRERYPDEPPVLCYSSKHVCTTQLTRLSGMQSHHDRTVMDSFPFFLASTPLTAGKVPSECDQGWRDVVDYRGDHKIFPIYGIEGWESLRKWKSIWDPCTTCKHLKLLIIESSLQTE